MRRRFFISFNEGHNDFDRVQGLLASIDCLQGYCAEGHILAGLYGHTFDETDPRLAALRKLLRHEGIEWSEREEHVYTDAEYPAFPLIELAIAMAPLEISSLECGTTYDLSPACPRCGTGAIQTSPLRVRRSDLMKKKGLAAAGADGEILVATQVMEALDSEDVTGVELRQVVAKGSDEPLPWWQMISSFVMPKMSPKTRGIILDETDHVTDDGMVISALPPCPRCRRDGRYHKIDVPYSIVYESKDVDISTLPDVVHTWESFGKSGIDKEKPQFSRFGEHRTLVKPKVFDMFRRLKVRHVRFTPVRIVD